MRTVTRHLIRPTIISGLAAILSGCLQAQAETKDQYSFDKIGIMLLPNCEITSVYAEDINNDGKMDIIAGTKDCGLYIFKNKVPEMAAER